jgi:hypothetical protein
MNFTDEKIKEICERKKFTSFWEIFDYMKLANYDEVEALMIASKLFNGDIWSQVVNASYTSVSDDAPEMTFASGSTYTSNTTDNLMLYRFPDKVVKWDPKDLFVDIFLMTEKASSEYLPVYKAYVETKKYERVIGLDEHIKVLTIHLTTELGMKLFKDGYNKLKVC